MRGVIRGLMALVFGISLGVGLANQLGPGLQLPFGLDPSSLPARVVTVAAADQDVNAAIQQVIQRSNDEQVQAIASRDSSAMADTVTSQHYQEMVQINQNLLDNGVTSIKLVNLEWGPITVNGNTATATTFETWSTTFNDGTTEQSRDRNDYALVLDGGTWKIQSDAHPDDQAGEPGGDPRAVVPPQPESPAPPSLPDDQNTSHNWSGYAAIGGGSYSAVSATWTVPQFNATDATGFGTDAAWVGIGGVRSRDLIQAGTQQLVSGTGRTHYEAWVETLPRTARPVPLAVHPGDSVTVSLSEESPDSWVINFVNNTTGQTYQQTEQYHSSHSSAEWVEEAPSSGRGGLLPLDNFGTIQFSDASAVRDGQKLSIADAHARAITMLGPANQALAVPSPLGDDGASFSVARTDAPATTAGPGRRLRLFPPEP